MRAYACLIVTTVTTVSSVFSHLCDCVSAFYSNGDRYIACCILLLNMWLFREMEFASSMSMSSSWLILNNCLPPLIVVPISPGIACALCFSARDSFVRSHVWNIADFIIVSRLFVALDGFFIRHFVWWIHCDNLKCTPGVIFWHDWIFKLDDIRLNFVSTRQLGVLECFSSLRSTSFDILWLPWVGPPSIEVALRIFFIGKLIIQWFSWKLLLDKLYNVFPLLTGCRDLNFRCCR